MNVPLKRYFALLSEYLRPQARRVLALAVLLFANVGLQLLNPQILRSFIDTATTQGSQRDLFITALLFIGVALANQALLIGVLVLLFFEDWRVGLGMTLFALIALAVLIRMRSIAVPYWTAVREASAHFFGFLGERLAGTEDIRSSGATGYVMHQFYALLREWLPLQRRAGLAGYSMWM